jgi:hypothetical protein
VAVDVVVVVAIGFGFGFLGVSSKDDSIHCLAHSIFSELVQCVSREGGGVKEKRKEKKGGSLCL